MTRSISTAGPLVGAYSGSHFWPLLPCIALVTAAIALISAALLAALGPLGTVLALLLITFLGGTASGANGAALLPRYWQYIGSVLPPRQAISLIRATMYFGGNDITTPIVALSVYAVVAMVVIWYLGRYRALQAKHSGVQPPAPDAAAAGRSTVKAVLVALAIVAVIQCLYSLNYMSANPQPVATSSGPGLRNGSAGVGARRRPEGRRESRRTPRSSPSFTNLGRPGCL